MQRIFSILLLSFHLVTNTELCELLKVPVLVSHYEEHKGSGNMTFVRFLQMHYFNGAPHDNTDMELPFKSTPAALVVSQTFSVSLPIQAFTSSLQPLVQLQNQPLPFYLVYLPSRSQTAIFQPPRIA